MSKVVIAGDASGTGTFTISAPNGNTDRTLVLPDEAGTVLTSASSIGSGQLTGDAIPIGVGQTWQDVAASRAAGTEYTNSTGRPIMVAVTAGIATYSYIWGYVDGVNIVKHNARDSATTTSQACAVFIVPAGSTYQVDVNVNGSTTSVYNWQELR